MSRPVKSVTTRTGHVTTEELEGRIEQENILKGNDDKITPPDDLSKAQKKIFRYIVKELSASGILSNLDTFILRNTAIAIDRLQQIEEKINDDTDLLFDSKLMAAQKIYQQQFFRCCNELSLSPQSRSKLANINFQTKANQEDPLLKLLSKNKQYECADT